MISTVVFDFADTIARLDPSREKIVQQFVKKILFLDLPLKEIERAYFYIQNFYFYSSVKIVDTKEKKEFYHEFNKKIFSNLGILHLIEPFLDDFFTYFTQYQKHWVLKQETIELFNYLKSRHIAIGLISNFDKVLRDILGNFLQIKDFFSYIHISQEVGCEKPKPEFYENFLSKYALDPKTVLYIGDNYELDFLPAHRLGIMTILLDEGKNYNTINDLPKIGSLRELVWVLENNIFGYSK